MQAVHGDALRTSVERESGRIEFAVIIDQFVAQSSQEADRSLSAVMLCTLVDHERVEVVGDVDEVLRRASKQLDNIGLDALDKLALLLALEEACRLSLVEERFGRAGRNADVEAFEPFTHLRRLAAVLAKIGEDLAGLHDGAKRLLEFDAAVDDLLADLDGCHRLQ